MTFGRILKAAFKLRNFAILAAVIIISYLTGFLPFTFVGLAGYLYFVMQTLRNEGFNKEMAEAEKLEGIRKLDWECSELCRETYGNVNKAIKLKLSDVMKQKDELMKYFLKHEEDPIKQKIVEQALKLVMAYISLAANYSRRGAELADINIREIVDRINYNNRKLGSLTSYDAVLELEKVIKLDEKFLENLKEEREELEKASVRLSYIESTIGAFKHQIMSADTSDPEVEEIENVVNEATALDNALTARRNEKLKG